MLTSNMVQEVYGHNSLQLCLSRLLKYLEGHTVQWDVDVQDATQIDDNSNNPSLKEDLVGIPLADISFNLGNNDCGGVGDDRGVARSESQPYMNSLVIEDQNL